MPTLPVDRGRVVPTGGSQAELKEPCEALPRKCLLIYLFIYPAPFTSKHSGGTIVKSRVCNRAPQA
jgi:hypothetical protein